MTTPPNHNTADQSVADERAKPILSHETLCSYMPPEFMFGDSLQPHNMRDIILAVRADAALAFTQPAPQAAQERFISGDDSEPDFWPIAKLTVSDGKIAESTFYAPALPDGQHDVFPAPTYLDEHTAAWFGVIKALDEVSPGWLDGRGNGIDLAVKAIRNLATPQPFPAPAVQSGELPYVMVKGEPHHFLGAHISVDVSTGDHDAGHRIFATVEDLQEEGENEYVFLAVEQSRNFATPPTQAIAQTAPAVEGEAIRNQALEDAAKCAIEEINGLRINASYSEVEEYAGEVSSAIRALKTAAPSQGAKHNG